MSQSPWAREIRRLTFPRALIYRQILPSGFPVGFLL